MVIVSLAIVVKAATNLLLLPNPQVNIYGAAISETLCYLFAAICVTIYLNKSVGLHVDGNACVVKPLAAGMFMTLVITLAIGFAKDVFSTTVGTLALIALCATVYVFLLWALKVFDPTELTFLVRRGQKSNT